jgi:hypothetical protein
MHFEKLLLPNTIPARGAGVAPEQSLEIRIFRDMLHLLVQSVAGFIAARRAERKPLSTTDPNYL